MVYSRRLEKQSKHARILIFPGHFARLQWVVVQEPSKQSFCLLQVQANSKYSQNPETFKTKLSCTKKSLKGPVAIRTQTFKTSPADLVSRDPQLLHCHRWLLHLQRKANHKEKEQITKAKEKWKYTLKWAPLKNQKRYKLKKYEVVYQNRGMISSLNFCLLHCRFLSANLDTFWKPNIWWHRFCNNLCQLLRGLRHHWTSKNLTQLHSFLLYLPLLPIPFIFQVCLILSLSFKLSPQLRTTMQHKSREQPAQAVQGCWKKRMGSASQVCLTQNNTNHDKCTYSDNSYKADYTHCDPIWSSFSLPFFTAPPSLPLHFSLHKT